MVFRFLRLFGKLFRKKPTNDNRTETTLLSCGKDELEKEYYEIINTCAKKEKDFSIQNSDKEHAAYVLKTIFQKAETKVYMFIYRFDDLIFKKNYELIKAAVEFLQNPEARLFVALQNPSVKRREDLLNVKFLLFILNASIKGQVEILDASEFANHTNYFFLNDKGHFRYTIKKMTQ